MLQLNDYRNIVVVGLGKTGLSCARFLHQLRIPFSINDSRENPPCLEAAQPYLQQAKVYLGQFALDVLLQADLIILSQGVPLQDPVIAQALAKGIYFISDVDLFSLYARAPIAAITGSNAKSTVTTLVGEIAKTSGMNVEVGGNLGIPLLDLLLDPVPDYYIVELSNFQLELTHHLQSKVACILNITPDHLDRYNAFEDYVACKRKIYQGCQCAIYNLEDPLTFPPTDIPALAFSLAADKRADFHLIQQQQDYYLSYRNQPFLSCSELKMQGLHNAQNALAAAAIAHQMGISLQDIAKTLKTFTGLAHRCQWVAKVNDVTWYNDSKGTNIGATNAAIAGLGKTCQGKIILLAGGLGKGADFTELLPNVTQFVKQTILFGKDASLIQAALEPAASTQMVADLTAAVLAAKHIASPGDIVLLSPACASWDMFKHFEHRGEVFMSLVKELVEHGDCCNV